jgi:diaminopimelate decarboxylase
MTVMSLDEFIRPTSGELTIESCRAKELAVRFGTPLFVFSEQQLRENYRRFHAAFQSRWPRPVHVLYAIKANFTLAVSRVLFLEGAGADVFTEGELHAALTAGARPGMISVNGSLKPESLLEQAIAAGACINIDVVSELGQISAVAERLERTAVVSVRAKPEYTELDSYLSVPSPYQKGERIGIGQWILENKWGLTVTEAVPLIEEARRNPHIRLKGVHSHVGRHHSFASMFGDMVPGLTRWIGAVVRETGWSPTTLDFGGGFTQGRDPLFRGGANDPEPPAPRIDDVAELVCETLRSELAREAVEPPELELEPGRFLVTNAAVLLATVGPIKEQPGTGIEKWVNVDASVAHLPGPEFADALHEVVVTDRADAPAEDSYAIVGPSCYEDLLAWGRPLPNVRPGDVIAFLDAGGYSDAFSSNVNAIPRPAAVLVSGGHVHEIKRRETVLDIFGRDRIPGHLYAVGSPDHP